MSTEVEFKPVILAVDDDPTNINVIVSHLSPLNPKFLIANSGKSALDILAKQQPDLIILDINMPDITGIDVCRKIKSDTLNQETPVLFLTSSVNDISEAFDVGGVDYILKPVKAEELLARVTTHLRLNRLVKSLDEANTLLEGVNESLEIKVQQRTIELVTANKNLRREIDERRRLQDKLSYLSNYDFVTRMYNRTSMEHELKSRLDLMMTSDAIEARWYLFFIDLDQFKVVNNSCGHVAGDELLRQIAEILRDLYTDDYICARMGGDEFAILLQSVNLEDAIKKAHIVKNAIEAHKFEWNNEIFRHTISIALVELDESVDSVSHLLSIAERTCFESKRKGGGEISIYNHTKEYIDKSQQQLKVIPILHHALENDQFTLFYQRIIPLNEEHPYKIEVLLRLVDNSGKVKPPSHFIPIAERYHLITEIDKWVINKTLEQMKNLPEDLHVSINLSGEFIGKSNSAELIKSMLSQSQIAPQRICFEITETSAISNVEATNALISELKEIGVQFSLDDFGTGTSSYEYLKQLPIDFVKIDGIFVRDIENDEINRKMVESILGIAVAKQVRVIAECVETPEALAILQEMQLDYYQGYLAHKPEPLAKLFEK
ncbi:two-component system response regulator [Glaciecola sp. 1036]|uniref:two-component system response regulator n=1 Tax=Alteromonadaceae TaxID=72275 RepID=UPI003D0769E3